MYKTIFLIDFFLYRGHLQNKLNCLYLFEYNEVTQKKSKEKHFFYDVPRLTDRTKLFIHIRVIITLSILVQKFK